MNFVQFRWVYWDREGQPPSGAIPLGFGPQQHYKILQYRERVNINEIGLQEPIWSEWRNID